MVKSLKWIILGLLGLVIAILLVIGTLRYLNYRQSQAASNSSSGVNI